MFSTDAGTIISQRKKARIEPVGLFSHVKKEMSKIPDGKKSIGEY